MIETPDRRLQTVVLLGQGARATDVGAKAAMLDRLLQLGAPVPPSGVVTAAAYRDFVEHAGLGAHLARLRTEPPPSSGQVEAARREIDRRFLDAPMSDRLADAIVALAHDVGDGGTVAVRSSATAEDLETASFAGQYRTSLGVDPGDTVDAVRLCWASLWHPGPRAYRRFRGLDDNDIAMAALIMPMLDPTWAGVLFTEDPARPSAIRIEMVAGLAESLVSGTQTPDVVTIDRLEIDALDDQPEGVRRLAQLALDLERRIGTPLDIEWALERGELSLLQTRPITTGQGVPDDDGFDVADAGARYTTAGIGEMLPGVLPPRLWDINSWLVEDGFRGLFRSLGADPGGLDGAHALVGRVRGRAALDLDLMEHIVETVPGGSAAELEHQYFGDALGQEGAPASVPEDGFRLRQSIRTLRARARAYQESELVIQAIDRVLADEPDLSELDDRALLTFRGRVLHVACRAMEAEISVAATASASYRGLEMFLREHLDADEATTLLQRLTLSDRATHSGRRALDLDPLIARLAGDEQLASARPIESWPHARDVLGSTPAGRTFIDDMADALRRAGSTSVFGGVTWDDVPELVWPMLHAGATAVTGSSDSGMDRREAALAEVERQLVSAPRWRFTRWATGQVVDVRRRFFRREANDAAAFLERREHTKAALLMLGGSVRRIDRELGRRLFAADRLGDAADVDLLTGREVAAALEGRPPPPNLIELRRRRLDAARLEPPLARVFRGRTGPALTPEIVGERITGWAGSPGRYEGVARVVESPRKSELRRGDVLVARTTDASWLPLFHVAGAIVVEQGGPLSHAAILAGELGMPAVINVPGIVERVRDRPGSMLTVDGNTGEVGIHPRDADPAVHLDDQECETTDLAGGTVPRSRPPVIGGGDANRLGVLITGLIGAGAVVLVARGVARTPALHGRCDGCPAQERLAREVARPS